MKRIQIDPRLLQRLRSLDGPERRRIGEAIRCAQVSFGFPHLHQGLGIRPLGHDYFELRIGLRQRLVFKHVPDALVFKTMGGHDDVRRFLAGQGS